MNTVTVAVRFRLLYSFVLRDATAEDVQPLAFSGIGNKEADYDRFAYTGA